MEENKRAAGRLNEIRQRRIRNRRMIVGISFVVFALWEYRWYKKIVA